MIYEFNIYFSKRGESILLEGALVRRNTVYWAWDDTFHGGTMVNDITMVLATVMSQTDDVTKHVS